MTNYMVARVNSGAATHLIKMVDYTAQGGTKGYSVGCGSFNLGNGKRVHNTGLEVKAENITCKKCQKKLEALAPKQETEEKMEYGMTIEIPAKRARR